MKAAPSLFLMAVLALTGCGSPEAEPPEVSTQRGVERSVADIRAAEAAMRAPVEVSRSVGELTAKPKQDNPDEDRAAPAE